jgi:hypothetical protein
MKRLPLAVLLVALLLVFPACYTLDTVNTQIPISMQVTNASGQSVVGHFESSVWVHHFIIGLVSANDPDVAKMIANQVKMKGGTGAVNVKITYQMSFVNGLLNIITLQIYNPFTLTVEGDVVK